MLQGQLSMFFFLPPPNLSFNLLFSKALLTCRFSIKLKPYLFLSFINDLIQ
jgi:hypothetical protein